MARSVVVALFTLVVANTAGASPPRLEIVGDACDLRALEADVMQLLPAHALAEASATHVRIETSRESSGVVANVWFPARNDGQRGPRGVRATTCDQLLESIGLVVAMALVDPGPNSEPEATAPVGALVSPPAITEREPQHTRAIETAVVEAVSLHTPRSTALELYAAGGTGLTAHGLRGQLLVGARAQRGPRSVSVQLRADAPEQVDVTATEHIRVLRSELSFSPCVHLGPIAGCGVASVGVIRGEATGLHAARSAYTPLASTGLRLTWEHDIAGPVAVRAYIEAQALLTSAEFQVDYMPVWTSERFEGSGGLGVLARFL